MKSKLRVALLLLAMLGASSPGNAQGWHHRGGPRVGVGVYLGPYWGGPVYSPYYYPPYGYGYPAAPVVVNPSPPVYIENTAPAQVVVPPAAAIAPAPPAAPASWYYCRDPAGYYPYVPQCKGAWEAVPAQPPAQAQ
jgi:hypothetical protein